MLPAKSIVAILVVLAGMSIWWGLDIDDKRTVVAIGSPLPAFSLKPLEGIDDSGFHSSALLGNFSLLNAFASWCAPCRDEHPLLVEIARRYPIKVLGMNVTDLPENAVSFLDRLGNPYDHVGADTDKSVAGRLQLTGLPHTFVVDPQGRLVLSHPGPISRDFVERELPKLLAGKTIQAEPTP